jgi:molecular chaperone HtpG
VDYPFTLQGVLYFPKLKHEMDASKAQVQLYCNNVFVSDNTQDVMPRFLTVLKGMIDCPEIPLNVSRSMLQNDPYVRKIAGHITKKVADRLTQLFRSKREDFEAYWQDIHPFVKFGMMEDEKFADAVKDVVLFKSSKGDNVTIPEYLVRNGEKAAGKVFYAEAGDAQATYLKLFEAEGLEAVYTYGLIDAHFIHYLESKDREVRWVRVDAAARDHLVATDDNAAKILDADGKTVDERLKAVAEAALVDKGVQIDVQSLKRDDVSGLITQNEQERRMNEMSAMWKGSGIDIPVRKTLLLNANSAVVKKLLDTPDPGQAKELAEHVYDLARLAHEGLQGDDLAAFIARSHKLLGG